MSPTLQAIVDAMAIAFRTADGRSPQHISRTGRAYRPGIGPHSENAALALVLAELRDVLPETACGQFLPYPDAPRQKCDLWIGNPAEWAIEVKMARFRGDNGKPDDTSLKDLLSPYASDRSALTDCEKLAVSGFQCRTALLVYGFDREPSRAMVICGVPIMWFDRSWSTNFLLERLPATRIPDPRSRPLQLITASREPPWLSAGARRATRVSDLNRAAAIVRRRPRVGGGGR